MFYGPIKALVSAVAAAGLGAFTPAAADAGALSFAAVEANTFHLVRAEEGAAWELFYSYWNGATLSRAATQFWTSSTGAPIAFTIAAKVAIVPDPNEVQIHLGGPKWFMWGTAWGVTTVTNVGGVLPSSVGTAASQTFAATNFLTRQIRSQLTSALTAWASAGWNSAINNGAIRSTNAGQGGWEYVARFGASQLAVNPCLIAGVAGSVLGAAEPSSQLNACFFGKDSADANIQFMVNDGAGACTKQDTGIPLVANGFYEVTTRCPPGGASVVGMLFRLDTGAIWIGSANTNLPAVDTILRANLMAGLNGTTLTTAMIMQMQSLFLRQAGV